MKKKLTAAIAMAALPISTNASTSKSHKLNSLEGTWQMEAAYELLPDGTRVTNYGEHPNGLLIVDADGHYSIQIFRPDRPGFVSGDKARGTSEEYRQAAIGSSTHFGTVSIDATHDQLTFEIRAASFPNWEGKRQVRNFSYNGDFLTYAVPASASSSGIIAYSVWRRVPSKHGHE